MGRLFWKIFLFIWLSQLFTVAGVGVAIWLFEADRQHRGIGPPDRQPVDEWSARNPPPPPPSEPVTAGIPQTPEKVLSDGERLGERLPTLPPGTTEREREREPPPAPMGHPQPGPEKSIFPPLLPLIAGSLFSLIFAALLAQYFARPIRSLSQAFEQVANGRLDARIGQNMAGRHDELADLGAGFDSMAERLQGLVEDKQRLLHDVSHELRSPLARLQAAIDLMQQQPDRSDEFIARIERESSRIDGLVEELLTFARLESGIPGCKMQEFDLTGMIALIVEDATFEAETKQCRVVSKMPEKACMKGDPELVHRAIENIVRNAIRYTPEGSCITLDGVIDAQNTWMRLEVADQGKGVSESELNLIFEPFYRSPTADRFKGYGIGMAITQRVIDAHQGRVSAKNDEHGGLVVSIDIPLIEGFNC